MKLKNLKLLALASLLFTSLTVVGCKPGAVDGGGGDDSSQQGGGGEGEGGEGEGSVAVYLVINEGKLDGRAGKDFPSLYLENAFRLNLNPNDPLPGASRVTSNQGAEFKGWMIYEGNGAPVSYSSVPNVTSIILYANFELGTGGNPQPGPTPGPGEQLNLTVNITVPSGWDISTIRDGGAVVYAYAFGGQYTSPIWVTTTGSGNTVNFTLDKTPEAFIVVRCASGTTTPSWADGVKWNQTEDITYVNGTYTYNATLQ